MITFDRDGLRFNYRVAGLAIDDGRVLLQTVVDIDFWVLPGGRAELGESAADTLRREMREELGLAVAVGRLLWIVESFFTLDNRRYHELGLYFAMTLPRTTDAPLEFRTVESGAEVVCRWHSFADLGRLRFEPAVLAGKLSSPPSATEHIVDVDVPR
jgi:8-oxo-dGTP pyrophosphatase MutT (NUDIX family)